MQFKAFLFYDTYSFLTLNYSKFLFVLRGGTTLKLIFQHKKKHTTNEFLKEKNKVHKCKKTKNQLL